MYSFWRVDSRCQNTQKLVYKNIDGGLFIEL